MSRAVLPQRPHVPVWLRPLIRRPGEVQFGVVPGGPIVDGLTAVETRLLARLDGALTLEATYREAGAAGVSRRRWRELLALTARLGVLVDAATVGPPPADRRPNGAFQHPVEGGGPACVVVDGIGPVSSEIASVVADECRTTVLHERADVDRVIADPLRRRPDVVVLIGSPVVDPRRGNLWLRHGIPHLPVTTAGPQTTVGPLADGSPLTPCLWCLDRHRTDRDEAWPTVMGQTSGPPPGHSTPVTDPDGRHEGLSHGLGQLVAGTVALFVSRVIAGHLPPRGVSVDVSLPWPRMDHRRWTRHPLCPGHPTGAAVLPGPTGETSDDDGMPRGA